MSPTTIPLFFANKPMQTQSNLEVTDKFSGKTVYVTSKADEKLVTQAIDKAEKAFPLCQAMSHFERRKILKHCVERISNRAEELAKSLCTEAGKPLKDSRGEVTRLIETFEIAVEECSRNYGEIQPLDQSKRGEGYTAFWKRFPIGISSFISPFNFPLNLVAHKIAPALALGVPFVLKPATRTPIGALILGEILSETDLPEGAFSIMPCNRKAGEILVTDPRIRYLSFTGSAKVGWDLKSKAGKKKVTLELGGNAAVAVEPDSDLDDAVSRILLGAFYQSGQSCISVQRIYLHKTIYEKAKEKLISAAKNLKAGNPHDPDTSIGPVIADSEAERIENWINEAKKSGAKVLFGGKREGALVEPTLIEGANHGIKLVDEEVFGPVAMLFPYRDFSKLIEEINRSRYGLQAGIFTRDIHKAMYAWERLEVGGVIINDMPSWRSDAMPYGGVKDSGQGREGVRFAMEDMTEPRVMVLRKAGI